MLLHTSLKLIRIYHLFFKRKIHEQGWHEPGILRAASPASPELRKSCEDRAQRVLAPQKIASIEPSEPGKIDGLASI